MNSKLEEYNKKLANSKVAIIGLGVSNRPLIDYLHELGGKVGIFEEKDKLIVYTGQVLREMTRFVACGDVCRYKLEK